MTPTLLITGGPIICLCCENLFLLRLTRGASSQNSQARGSALLATLIAIRLNNPHKARIWGETRCGNLLMGKSNRGNRKSPPTTTPDAISPTRGSDSRQSPLSSSQTINCISIIQLSMQPSPASVTSTTEQHNCAQTNFGDCGACNFSKGEPARKREGGSQF